MNPLLPKALNKVLLKGLAKNREARYASAGELARDFAHAVGMAGQTTTLIRLDEASASPISPVSLWQSKRRKNYQAGYWIPVAMLALLVMFLVIRIIRDDDRPTITTITDGNNASPVYFPTVTYSPTVTVVSMFTRAPTVTSTFTPTLSGEDQGWTAGAATMPASPTYTASPQVRVYNTAGGVVRSGPGEWYPVIAEVGHKDSFRVVACSEANLTWYLIVLPWGEQGWISGADAVPSGGLAPAEIPTAATIPPTPDLTLTDIILPTPQIQVNSSVGGFVRSGPGVGYPVIGEVKAAESFAVLGYWAGDPVWYLIMLPWGEQGW
ncbi:MAG TPA: hypothetical protein VHP83_09960, partial [Aggregatilineaceae bacterium]|nr:hypothetical protein [Aggregatilineaceae bacterium]